MRKLRTLENTKPADVRAFKRSLKMQEKYTKESVGVTLNTYREIINTSLKDLNDFSKELQYEIQDKCLNVWIEPSKDGILTEAEVIKLAEPLASKLQHLYEDYLFTTIDSYTPIVNIHNNKPLDPKLNHEIILKWLGILNDIIVEAHNELKNL